MEASNIVELSSYRAKRDGKIERPAFRPNEVVFAPFVGPIFPVIVWVPFWFQMNAVAPVGAENV